MALENIVFGILAVIAIAVMIFLCMLAYAVWKVGAYTKALVCIAIAFLLFLFFFGNLLGLGLPRCFGFC